VLLAIELSLRCQMRDLHFKSEEDRTKTAVVVEDDRYFGQTYTQVIFTVRAMLARYAIYTVRSAVNHYTTNGSIR